MTYTPLELISVITTKMGKTVFFTKLPFLSARGVARNGLRRFPPLWLYYCHLNFCYGISSSASCREVKATNAGSVGRSAASDRQGKCTQDRHRTWKAAFYDSLGPARYGENNHCRHYCQFLTGGFLHP